MLLIIMMIIVIIKVDDNKYNSYSVIILQLSYLKVFNWIIAIAFSVLPSDEELSNEVASANDERTAVSSKSVRETASGTVIS